MSLSTGCAAALLSFRYPENITINGNILDPIFELTFLTSGDDRETENNNKHSARVCNEKMG